MSSTKTLIVIAGPTAVGKTELAIKVARHFDTEIVSADSRQIYKELEIGTAKPTEEELSMVTHHFINTKSIQENYDAGTYAREARGVIDQLFKTHDYLVMCGGSGLYIKAVTEGFDDLPEVSDVIRSLVIADYNLKGLLWLQEEVASHDPDYFEVVDRHNPQRLMRALEVIRSSGKTFSGFRKKEKIDLPFKVIKIGLELEREELYKRIDDRMDKMISQGLFEEAEKFFTLRHLNSLQTVGYQEPFGFFEGAFDREEAIRLMKRNSRRYAKRQMTWFKKDGEINWFGSGDIMKILNVIKDGSV
ncbi:MAG: tRNA (adenosine(37)-N6)-dimethylallyltransferase MiaA [Cyclobacteriaceae bacterium]|nr:tRNA (adenosine(37)-N6)-dimethylallyltransferase MiaA [Cyclobacteriaceae bacterium]